MHTASNEAPCPPGGKLPRRTRGTGAPLVQPRPPFGRASGNRIGPPFHFVDRPAQVTERIESRAVLPPAWRGLIRSPVCDPGAGSVHIVQPGALGSPARSDRFATGRRLANGTGDGSVMICGASPGASSCSSTRRRGIASHGMTTTTVTAGRTEYGRVTRRSCPQCPQRLECQRRRRRSPCLGLVS